MRNTIRPPSKNGHPFRALREGVENRKAVFAGPAAAPNRQDHVNILL
jgi:hypothetical protein